MDEINIIRGDSATISVPITNKNKEPIDINTIDELYLTCRVAPSKQSTILFRKEKEDFYVTEDNKFKVNLLPEDTQSMEYSGTSKVFYFDIEVTVGTIRKSRIYAIDMTKDYTIHDGSGVNGGN